MHKLSTNEREREHTLIAWLRAQGIVDGARLIVVHGFKRVAEVSGAYEQAKVEGEASSKGWIVSALTQGWDVTMLKQHRAVRKERNAVHRYIMEQGRQAELHAQEQNAKLKPRLPAPEPDKAYNEWQAGLATYTVCQTCEADPCTCSPEEIHERALNRFRAIKPGLRRALGRPVGLDALDKYRPYGG